MGGGATRREEGLNAHAQCETANNNEMVCDWSDSIGSGARRNHAATLGTGKPARAVDDLAVSDANQSDPPRAFEYREGADRCRFWERSDRKELPGCCVGPPDWNDSYAAGGLGHVLQRNGCLARRPPVHQRRHATIRSVS